MTRIFGVDYAGHANAPALKAAGVRFVCRYLSTPGNPKNLTMGEAVALRGAGILLVTVFETTASRALSGRPGGIADARAAQAQLTAVGAPVDAPVYFAVDFDSRLDQQAAINGYLLGAASVLGHDRVGVYGGYWPVSRALNAGVCRYAWQTYAWSGGNWDGRAQLRQVANGRSLAGATVDFDWALTPNFGQWYATPAPTPPHPHAVAFPKDDTFWTWLRWRTGSGEFAPFGARYKPVRPNVPQRIPSAWWRSLSFYLKNRPSV